jgi:NADPH2:quinone reductase
VQRARIEAGEWLLVLGGAGGTGSAAISLGRALGARVIATAGGSAKTELCAELGAERVIDHQQEEFATAVLDDTGDVGADVICDLLGGSFVEGSWRCIARGGRYLAAGFSNDPEGGAGGQPLRPACIGNFSIVGVLGAYVDPLPSALRRMGLNPFDRKTGDAVHADLLRLVASGEVRPRVGSRVSMQEAGAALELHEARRTTGRTVVVVDA